MRNIRSRVIWIALIVFFELTVSATAVHAQRVALVVGNSSYRNVDFLQNAVNDADSIGEVLRGLDFSVVVVKDQDVASFRSALRGFSDAARNAEVAIFYYAGHALQIGQRDRAENYLVPTDARLVDSRDVEEETIGIGRIIELMEGARARILILDACRNNPFLARMTQRGVGRSAGRGLAVVDTRAEGTLIAFSTAPGTIAEDGEGTNSPFTASLVRHLPTQGLELRGVLTRVRADVARSTGNAQVPWANDGMLNEIFLAGGAANLAIRPIPPAATGATLAPSALELALWNNARSAQRAEDVEEYLNRFPRGAFASLAERRLVSLRGIPESRGEVRDEIPRVLPWTGSNIQRVTPEIATFLGLSGEPRGALIARATPDAPYSRAGIKRADIVLNIGGHDIVDYRDLPRAIALYSPGQVVPHIVFSEGRTITRYVVIGRLILERPESEPSSAVSGAAPNSTGQAAQP